MNFVSNSTMDEPSPTRLSPLTEHSICNISVKAQELCRLVKRLGFTKVTVPDKIQMIVLKTLPHYYFQFGKIV